MIGPFLAKVTYVAPAAYDAQGHLRTEATIKLDVYATKNSTAATPLTPHQRRGCVSRMLSAITFS